jgi:5-formyltetrahydrofolate cyclo-ligase
VVGAQSLGVGEAKAAMRREVLAARAAMSPDDRARQAELAVGALLRTWEPQAGDRVAIYASFGTEPSTERLRSALETAGALALLPVVLADRDLSWATPGGTDLGPDAIAEAALVVVPGLAADLHGHRLGRGGGSYDRALQRVPPGVRRVLLAYQGELRAAVPSEPHDQPVTHVALPDGVVETSAWLGA